jgi:hypothetical protein
VEGIIEAPTIVTTIIILITTTTSIIVITIKENIIMTGKRAESIAATVKSTIVEAISFALIAINSSGVFL